MSLEATQEDDLTHFAADCGRSDKHLPTKEAVNTTPDLINNKSLSEKKYLISAQIDHFLFF